MKVSEPLHLLVLALLSVTTQLIAGDLKIARAVQRIDFVYHPVAEYLAAAHVASMPGKARLHLLSEIGACSAASGTFLAALEEMGEPQ